MMTAEVVWVPLVGGPYDGQEVPVQADESGQLPRTFRTPSIGPADLSVPPYARPQAGVGTQLYQLQDRGGLVYMLVRDDLEAA